MRWLFLLSSRSADGEMGREWPLLERKQLLGAERLVVDLSSGFDKVLQVGAGEEVAEVHKLAVVLVLDCDC